MIINKPTKIFLIVFSVILLIITIATIVYVRFFNKPSESQVIVEEAPKVIENKIEDINTDDNIVVGAKLEDVYNLNLINVEYKTDRENNVNVKYPQISNLNNSSVQEKINNEIRDRISRILSSNNFRTNSDSTAYVDSEVTANFSDVLSVKIFVQFKENYSKNYGINFSLVDGERISIKDLFISNAPIKNIITFSAYKTIAADYYTAEGISNEFYVGVEPEILSFLVDYNNDKVTEFSFNPNVIELYREGRTIRINMLDFAPYIAIYNRYKSGENLYGSSVEQAKDIPVFVKRPKVMYDLYEKVNDTCYIDAVIYKAEDKEFTEKELEIIEEYKNKLIERLKNVKIESNIYYSIYVSVFHGVQNERNILVFNEDEKYATVKEDFYNKIYATVLNAQRDLHTEDKIESKINVLSENMIGANVDQQRFDIETGRNFDELMQELEKQKQEELEKQRQEELQNQIQNQNQVTEQTENTISNNVQNQVENETENSVNNTMTEGTNNTTTNTADNTNQTIDAVITF